MTEDQRKQYEEAAKEYALRNAGVISEYISKKSFLAGCEHAHEKVEKRSLLDDAERKAYLGAIDNAKKEAHNRAIDEVEKWALSMWARNEHSIFTELKKIRK